MLPAPILTGSSFVMMFPIAIDKAAIAGALLSGIGTLASFLFEPLKRKDRLGHRCARVILICIFIICLGVIAFGLSEAWLFLCLVPPLWLLVRWVRLNRMCRRYRATRRSERDICRYKLADKLTSMELFEWEIRGFLLPRLRIFFEIGAIGRAKSALARLSDYRDADEVYGIETLICSLEHRHHEMLDRIKSKLKLLKPGDSDYPLYVNNLYHAAMSREDSVGIEYSFGLMERYVALEKDVNKIPVEMLDAMMYRYDTSGNADGVARTMAIIGRCEPKTYSKYLYLNDIVLYFNKRHNNIPAVCRYLDEAYLKLEKMEPDEEHRLTVRLRLVLLHIEYDYKWKEITVGFFENAEYYLSYSQTVAIEYVRMLVGALNDVNRRYNLTPIPEHGDRLVAKTVGLAEQYMQKYKTELFELSDEFLYRKRDAYRFLIDLAHIGQALNGHMDVYARQLIDSYDVIVALCRKNGELSELIHNIMVYIDEYFALEWSIAENYRRNINDSDIVAADGLLKANRPKIADLFVEYKELLKRFDYDRMLAFYTLFAAQFSKMLGTKDDVAFFLTQFEKHKIDICNYRMPVQQMYHALKQWLQDPV